jgi:chaperonin GroES
MGIRPLQDRIVVQRFEQADETEGGIIVPDTVKEKPIQGEVVAVGRGKVLKNGHVREPQVAVGDYVLFRKYAGTEVEVDDAEQVVLREDDILAVMQ